MTDDEQYARHHSELAHDCVAAQRLVYVGEYGAPGHGQAWRCSMCGKEWARLWGDFYPAEAQAHILTIDDVM